MTELARQPISSPAAEMIDEAISLLVEAAHPETIILFGSYARGDFNLHSDLDFLVIYPAVEDPFEEMVRLTRVLGHLGLPSDVIVLSRTEVERRRQLKGTVLYHALREGTVLHGTA